MENYTFTRKDEQLKFTIVFGTLLLLSFAVLDIFMLPEHYTISWIVRISPVISLFIILLFFKHLLNHTKIFVISIIITGELAMLILIAIASPDELAYRVYYEGIILTMYWTISIYRLPTKIISFISFFTVVIYNLIFFFIHKIDISDVNSIDFSWFLNSNFQLISAAAVVTVIAHFQNKYHKGLKETQKEIIKNSELLTEKNISLEEAYQKISESDNLKTAFLANISHEIRTPLNSIIGMSQLINDNEFESKQIKQFTKVIMENGDQLLTIITDIIDISEIESGEKVPDLAPFNVAELLESMYHYYLPQTENKNLKFETNIPSEISKSIDLYSDYAKVEKIIHKLLSNAIKFTYKGTIKLGFNESDKDILFFVSDTGIGISDEEIEIIFDSFRQLEDHLTKKYGGTGIGLTIARKLTHILGGTIWVKSKLGAGSIFYFTIPKNIDSTKKQID